MRLYIQYCIQKPKPPPRRVRFRQVSDKNGDSKMALKHNAITTFQGNRTLKMLTSCSQHLHFLQIGIRGCSRGWRLRFSSDNSGDSTGSRGILQYHFGLMLYCCVLSRLQINRILKHTLLDQLQMEEEAPRPRVSIYVCIY